MGKKIDDDYDDIVNEAREGFDLGEYLRGRRMRTQTVRLFTDEVLGEEVGGYEKHEPSAENSFRGGFRSWGLVGEVIELSTSDESREQNAKQIASLKRQIAKKAAELEKTALEVELRAIPEAVEKGATRAARKELGVTTKSLTPDQEERLNPEIDAQILSRMIVSVKKNETGEVSEGITVDSARALKGFLPKSEYGKLLEAIIKLQYQSAIGERAVEDLDF